VVENRDANESESEKYEFDRDVWHRLELVARFAPRGKMPDFPGVKTRVPGFRRGVGNGGRSRRFSVNLAG
jgi:hypothetical protein